MNDNNPPTPQTPRLGWLALGALAGLLAAAWGLLERAPGSGDLPADAVARVGDTFIDAASLDRAVTRLRSATGQAPDADARLAVLQQMIEEELLVQRGLELGMAESEPSVRAAIVQSLVASVTAEADAADPDDATLHAFLEDNAERYTYPSAMRIDAWISDDEALAEEFLAALREDAGAVAPDGLTPIPGLPRGAAPLARLRMFLGPAIAAAAAEMPVGDAAVFARQGRRYVVRVSSRETGVLADLDSVRSQVLIDYRRRLADERLRDYLNGLRRQADIAVVALP